MAKFWQVFKRLEEEAQKEIPEETFVEGDFLEVDRVVLEENKLRRAMWVMTPSGVGIVQGVYKGFIEVQLTDKAGLNLAKQSFPANEVSQAKLGQIPQPRRPSEQHGNSLGYL